MTPAQVDPEVAAALLGLHLGDFLANSPYAGDDWQCHDTGDPLTAVIGIPVRDTDGGLVKRYHVLLDGRWYDTWPPRVTFVERVTDGDDTLRWKTARLGSPAYPLIGGSPGAPPGPQPPISFALHDRYPFSGGRVDQLVCFSYSLDYYLSGHTPTPAQQWQAGKDRLDATLNRLYRVLNSSAHLGPHEEAAA